MIELRDPAELRLWVAQGLCLARVIPPWAAKTSEIFVWAQALASEGESLPPFGFLADLGHLAFRTTTPATVPFQSIPNAPTALLRRYEDYALGKLLADSNFERAVDALRQYSGADRSKGLLYLIRQMRAHLEIPGAVVSPAALKALGQTSAETLLNDGYESIAQGGALRTLTEMLDEITREIRNCPTVIGPEDVFELERRTALAPFGQRVALRQVLQAVTLLQEAVPRQRPPSRGRPHEVQTRIVEEDTYPVGGFASIATRGSIESLLHSQLAFMEPHERPDLFDIKFLRDELLYYSRDENRFLRRRRNYYFVLHPDLVDARVKDGDLPCQRVILLLAFVVVVIRALVDWLQADALKFEIILLNGRDPNELASEAELLAVLLADQISNGTVSIRKMVQSQLIEHWVLQSRRSQCYALIASTQPPSLDLPTDVAASRLVVGNPPVLAVDETSDRTAPGGGILGWKDSLTQVFDLWI